MIGLKSGPKRVKRRDESGQALLLFMLGLTVLLGMAAMTIDVGLAFVERRNLQNAVDAAALAAAQDYINGESDATATATAVHYLQRHGFSAPEDTFEVNIPPTSGQYAGLSGYVEVLASSEAPSAFLLLFLDAPYSLSARSVAEGKPASLSVVGGGGSDPDGGGTVEPPPATVPTVSCGGPTVDGRVTSSDGYTKFGDLGTGSIDYGDVFVACDANFYHFALQLNGPSTGGDVANENVYQCKPPKPGKPPKLGECTAADNPNYHTDYNTGWPQNKKGGHTFPALEGSDRARFQLACDGVVQHDFVQDYLYQDGSTWKSGPSGDGGVIAAGPAASASSLEWNLENPTLTGWGDDPGEDPALQSPPFSPSYPTYDSEYDGWIWEMIYEFKVPKQPYDTCSGPVTFALVTFPGQTGPVGGIHSSPAKIAGGESVFIISEDGILKLVE